MKTEPGTAIDDRREKVLRIRGWREGVEDHTKDSTIADQKDAPPESSEKPRSTLTIGAKANAVDLSMRPVSSDTRYKIMSAAMIAFIIAAISLSRLLIVREQALATSLPIPSAPQDTQLSDHGNALEKWIEQQVPFAKAGIYANIGPASGAGDGVVIASPSWGEYLDEPDYYYTWTRDSALTLSSLLPLYLPPQYLRPWTYRPAYNLSLAADPEDPLMELLIRAYADSQARIQIAPNPSGDLWSGGLNEPKFNVDETRFDGNWGRPQRDGPALRALALIPYAQYLLDRGYPADIEYVHKKLYDPNSIRKAGSVIKNDLEEVGGGWWQTGFDLWEEVRGHHLFTLVVSLRALQAGTTLAERLDDTGAARFYRDQASKIIEVLPEFWFSSEGYYKATKSLTSTLLEPEVTPVEDQHYRERTGLDCAFPLSIIHGGLAPEHSQGHSGYSLSASDPASLATLRRYLKSFEGMYRINNGSGSGSRSWTSGWAVGRYAEDIYNGVGIGKGNPWFICTFSVAQVFYLAQNEFHRKGSISLTNLSLPFFTDLLRPTKSFSAGEEWSRDRGDRLFEQAIRALGAVGDAFMEVGRRYTDHGRMSEQIDRNDGSQIGAKDLTWSYASFLEAARARQHARDAMKGL